MVHITPSVSSFSHGRRTKPATEMGMWMLLLWTIRIKDIAWFAVNGVPTRYSRRKHVLISCLVGHEYLKRHLKLESYKFVDEYLSDR